MICGRIISSGGDVSSERVTVTLPSEIVRDIARREGNRSKFVLEAVRRELARRRREELRRSLERPHGEVGALGEAGFGEWAAGLPAEEEDLVEVSAGRKVGWLPGEGWVEGRG
jgi:hypothetical protein